MIKKGPISIEGEVIASESSAPKINKAQANVSSDQDPYLVHAILGLLAPVVCSGIGVIAGLPLSIYALKSKSGIRTLAIIGIVLNSLALVGMCCYFAFIFLSIAGS